MPRQPRQSSDTGIYHIMMYGILTKNIINIRGKKFLSPFALNCLYPYVILAIHFKEEDWFEKTRDKFWFRPECEEALRSAIESAQEIISKKAI